MRATVKKWGNSAAVRVPAAIMKAAGLELDALVDIHEDGGRIVIEPLREAGYDLETLLAEIKPENIHSEVETGGPVGHELL